MIYLILAFLSGCFVIVSMVLNSRLANRIGVFQGTLVNYIVGLIGATIVLFFAGDGFQIGHIDFSAIPLWAYVGGAIGVFIVAISNVVIPKIPTIYSALLMFVGQLFTAMVIDYFIGNPVTLGKVVGGMFIIAGLIINFNIDRKQETPAPVLE